MGIEAVLKAVEAVITSACGNAGESCPNFAFGSAEANRQEAPPRIVWVPIAAQRNTKDVTRGHPTERTLWGRTCTIQARVWTETFDGGEKLVRHMMAALQAKWPGSVEYIGEAWDPEDDRSFGFLDVVTFTASMPLRDEPQRTVKPTSVPIDGAFVQQEIDS
jgi:hypothetical protein